MDRFSPGQRWISDAEPELGLGTLVAVDGRQIEIVFRAIGESRRYAIASAPLRRAEFRPGDRVATRDGTSFVVEEVEPRGGLLLYRGQGVERTEDELADALFAGGARERLCRGQVDAARVHSLRTEALTHLHRLRSSPVRGFLGGRIDLIPHQLFIADEVARRYAPRVLLADEVGLGKTIEACLVLHRQLLSGRVGRVLILVPDSLVHQWFVELVRRFHLWFKLFDRERCASIREATPEANPFLDEQLVLTSIDFLLDSPRDAHDACEADWDVLIVDEAHRLSWAPGAPSPAYRLAERLATRTPSVLLLSGTPEQLGREGHFARLRLLDPDRHTDLATFESESRDFAAIADLVDCLTEGTPISDEQRAIARRRDPTGRLAADFDAAAKGDDAARARLVTALLDRHGTGRVLFRNTRAAVAGFPRRVPHLFPLPGGREHADLPPYDYSDDPRIAWLLDLLEGIGDEKVLLICHAREQVAAILAAIESRVQLKIAAFHEELTLLQRDRNAAWFAEPDGARLLVSSEIGSEGRNFQFARHLVLFDLPIDPELLEQRIGRLDRIGQRGDVEIHVPYPEGTAHALLARWHHEAANDLATSLRGGSELLSRVRPDLEAAQSAVAQGRADESGERALFEATIRHRDDIAERLERGRDRLVERTSLRPERAARVRDDILAEDEDPAFEAHLLRLLEHFGVEVDELRARTYRLGTDSLYVDAIAGLPSAGVSVTFSRKMALEREDLVFLTRDHPLAQGALELLLGGEQGNSAFAVWPAPEPQGLLLEAHYVVEAVAPRELAADRFLPPTPVRIVVDQSGTQRAPATIPSDALLPGRPDALLAQPAISATLLPRLFAAADEAATARCRERAGEAAATAVATLGAEVERLRALQAVNDRVRDDEITRAERELDDLAGCLRDARVRLDAARLIWHGPPKALDF